MCFCTLDLVDLSLPKCIKIGALFLKAVGELDGKVCDGNGDYLTLLVRRVRDSCVEVVEESVLRIGKRLQYQADLGLK